MSLQRGRKLKKFFTAFLICGAFLFLFSVNNASAAYSTSTYDKLPYGTLSATEWNDLLKDFANTWLPLRMEGPIGIATSAPNELNIKLDVNGVVRATGFIGMLTGSVTAGNVTGGTFGSNYGGGNYSFGAGSNVGIGFTNPQVELDVLGSGNFTGTVNGTGICIGGACQYTWGQIVSAGGGNLWNGTTTSAIWNANTGFNVGIGTTNPTTLFAVATSSTPIFNVTSGGRVGIGTTNPTAKLNISDNNTTATSILIGNTSAGGKEWYFNDIGSGVAGRVGNMEIGVSGTGNIMSIQPTGNVGIGGTSAVTAPVLYMQSTGNVGIGTTTPSEKLFVVGNIALDSNSGSTAAQLKFKGNTNSGTDIQTGAITALGGHPSSAYMKFYTQGDSFNMRERFKIGGQGGSIVFNSDAESPLLTLLNGGNLGINTTNPTTKLDVNGSLRVNSATISLLNQAGVVMADDSGNLYATSSAVATGIPTGTNGQTLRSNGTNWLANSTLFNDGTNIGIGTTTPTSKLDVFGTFEATASSSSIILDANGNILIGI